MSTAPTAPEPSAGPASSPARRDVWLVLLGLAVVVGVLLRIPHLGDSLFGDELVTYFDVTGRSLGGTVDAAQSSYEITPPLFLLLANLTQGLGDAQEALRFVPFACGILAIPLTWLLGVRALDRRAATVAAAVVAFTPILVFYSSEARAYSLMMVLVLGSTLALWEALHRDGDTRPWWLLYAACSCAAMYTHYSAAFVLMGQGAWALALHRGAWRRLLAANALAAIAYLPWLGSYQDDQDNPASRIIGVLQPFGWHTFTSDVAHWAIGHPIGTGVPLGVVPRAWGGAAAALGVALAVAAVGWEVLRDRRTVRVPTDGQVLVAVLAVSGPLIAAVYSAVSVSVFLPRNLIVSSPGLALLLAAIVTLPRATRLWVPAALLLLLGFAAGGLRLTTDAAQRPDFTKVERYLQTVGGPAPVVVDVPLPSPGSLTALEVAAAPGRAEPTFPNLLRLGRPTLAAQQAAARPGGGGQFADLPYERPQTVARRAERLARGRDIFLLRTGVSSPYLAGFIDPFLAALAPRYRPASAKVFPGLFGYATVTVTVLRRTAG